jgi:hypothetical protein
MSLAKDIMEALDLRKDRVLDVRLNRLTHVQWSQFKRYGEVWAVKSPSIIKFID